MSKVKVVVYLLIAIAILGFIVLSTPHNPEEPNVRLNRRLGFKLEDRAPHFDPLVTKIKRAITMKDENNMQSASDPQILYNTLSVKEVVDTYQYLTSGGRLNTTLRLIILFPFLDREPKDGAVSFNELQAWITQQAMERLDYVTQAELNSKDMDKDSALSFQEYLPHFTDKDIENRDMGHGEAGWWMEKFNIADIDHNGLLNFTELREHIGDETDGKLGFKEFEDHVYITYENYMDFENNGIDIPNAKDKFFELDADDNKDGKLSQQEMLNHEYIFYNTVHDDGHLESDDAHDEL
ncbi:hypothetical protein PIB30_024868 [Stylosanthes scabra]|uniref:EF-hand domain-containing protein n=1 Tax=Stylosanthes scabra TaxID=79078 RepID=A0ABU6QA48_9FABA|nr:hypothetical protein [Stylosanthes scabra]